ncbi:DUF3060 domain-containing protein [Leptotrichia sp. OH3620_COT-345]|uniref:DUF3060 domain-containing protein n=1 Tax=Leptotrichia sp. OH3620_COT-345 TaxID=2491048 RepID=UPI000F648003|nr:DUF3060 domain-containing protein [Leptotrichia sp. OH3620_COT-345]RRD39802.1 DUF3060 domain-containing protein [Leptotrichia sp. OH3620_COT-345]
MRKIKNILFIGVVSILIMSCTGIGIGVGVPIGPVSVGVGTTIKIPTGSTGKVGKEKGKYVVNGTNNNKTVKLNGETVEIIGSSNKLTIKGKASSIIIKGASNTVNVETVGNIVIEGAANTVIYEKSLTGELPYMDISGAGSEVYKK